MKVIAGGPYEHRIAFFEDQVKGEASDWYAPPFGATHWSFAVKTEHNLGEGDSVDIEISNNEIQPKADADGTILVSLTPTIDAAYMRAWYKWVRAVKRNGKNKAVPVTVYGCFICPTSP